MTRIIKVFEWKDSHRILFPSTTEYSHFYSVGQINGATRIDRKYIWGEVTVHRSEYIPVAFSDHYGVVSDISLLSAFTRQVFPRGSRSFKIRNAVAQDAIFQGRVSTAMENWKQIRNSGLDTLTWWELVVKPGVRNLAVMN